MTIEFYKYAESTTFGGYIIRIIGKVNQKDFEVFTLTEDEAKSTKKDLASGKLKTPLEEPSLYILKKDAVGNCPPIYQLENGNTKE